MTAFLDTNILVYAQLSERRSAAAQALLARGGVISAQVLNEFANVLFKKLKRSWPEIEAAIENVVTVLGPPLPLTFETNKAATALARDNSLHFYDALIIASAIEAGPSTGPARNRRARSSAGVR